MTTTMMMIMMMIVALCLDFEIQQVAVDLVVNIGVVLLLTQIQSWDFHSCLQTQRYSCYAHSSCIDFSSLYYFT